MQTKKRLRAVALLLPVFGTLMFLPPYVSIFDQPGMLWGVPVLHVYIFAIWMAGIVLTALVSRRLIAGTGGSDGGDATPPDV